MNVRFRKNIKFKVNRWFSKFRLRQQLLAFKEFCMEKRLSNIFKTTNVTKLMKTIPQSSYRVLQVKSKSKH